MSPQGWDRQAYLAQRQAAHAAGGRRRAGPPSPVARGPRRPGRLARFGRVFNGAMDSLTSMTMYSSNPQLARTSMIYMAQREVQKYKEDQAEQRAIAVAQRAADLAHEEDRMRVLGRVMADELVKRVEEQRQRGGR